MSAPATPPGGKPPGGKPPKHDPAGDKQPAGELKFASVHFVASGATIHGFLQLGRLQMNGLLEGFLAIAQRKDGHYEILASNLSLDELVMAAGVGMEVAKKAVADELGGMGCSDAGLAFRAPEGNM